MMVSQSKEAPIPASAVKDLREMTGAGVMECKRALVEAGGDKEKAASILKERGLAKAKEKALRTTSQGLVEAYVHSGGRIGALVEVNCETDFVARTEAFKELAHDVAMQVAAMGPKYVAPEDAPSGTSSNAEEECLLLQPFIKDNSKKIGDIIAAITAKLGENIRVKRFARFELGE